MRVTLKLMRVGMSMQQATITEWFREPGDKFATGDPIYSFETDKVTQEVAATASGKLIEVLVPAGEDADVGAPLCVVDIEVE